MASKPPNDVFIILSLDESIINNSSSFYFMLFVGV